MVAAEGTWAVAYVLFIALVSLEIPLWIAGGMFIALCMGHLASAIIFTQGFRHLQLSELIANNLTWSIIALTGFWIHRRAEGGTRKAFLDTRQSIQARLAAHDENDKLGKACFGSIDLWCTQT